MLARLHPYLIGLFALLGTLLLFTSWYSIGYLLLIAYFALFGRLISVNYSLFRRFILYLLILLASIPLVGIVCFFANIQVYPVLVAAVVFVLEALSFLRKDSPAFKLSRQNIILQADGVAIILALVPPLVMAGSFFSKDYAASAFQLTSNGWDNGSHILMMYSATTANGFNHRLIEKGDNHTDPGVEGYPQAWHLATTNFFNGFGQKLFSPEQPFLTMYVYLVAITMWSLLAAYILSISAWNFFLLIKKRKPKLIEAIALLSLSFLVQLFIIYGSFNHGFSNYIGVLCYLLLMLVFGIEWLRSSKPLNLFLALFFGVSAILQWFLVLPIVLLTILAALLWNPIHKGKLNRATLASFYAACIASLVVSFVPVYIFLAYTPPDSGDQLNAGSYVDLFNEVNAVFPVNVIFFAIVSLFTLFYGVIYSKLDIKLKRAILLCLMPTLLFSFGLFLYQNMTNHGVSYYFMKVLGISLVMTSIASCALFADACSKLATKIKEFKLLQLALPLVLLAMVTIYSGQSFYGFFSLFRDNTRISTPVATEVSNIMVNTDPSKDFIVIFRNLAVYEDYNSKLPNRVTHQPRNCAYWISRSDNTPEDVLERIDTCADELHLKGQSLHVVTSRETEDSVTELHKPNVIIHNVK